jgi:hypothetical protein
VPQLEVAEEFQQILKFVVYRRVRSMRFQKCNLNIPLLFLIGLPNQKGIFPMLSEAEKRKGLEPQNWVEISVSDLSAPRLSLQVLRRRSLIWWCVCVCVCAIRSSRKHMESHL